MAFNTTDYKLIEEAEEENTLHDIRPKRPSKFAASLKAALLVLLVLIATITGTAIGTLHPLSIWKKSMTQVTDCGHSSASAMAAGCVMEPLTYAWMSPECQFPEVTNTHTPFKDFQWYAHENMTEPLTEDEIMRGQRLRIWTNGSRYHLEHCLFLYRKLSYAMEHKKEFIDSKSMSHEHAYHCIKQLETEGFEDMTPVTHVDLAVYNCNRAPWTKTQLNGNTHAIQRHDVVSVRELRVYSADYKHFAWSSSPCNGDFSRIVPLTQCSSRTSLASSIKIVLELAVESRNMVSLTSTSINPFKLSIAQSTLDDLQLRLRLTRWPDKEPVNDWSQGVPLAAIQDLCDYWQTKYDWRRCEALLNSYPQFTTTIDGIEFYFLHIRSKHEDALPMLLTHGWPGSVLEFRHIIDKLVDPESHGGSSGDAFHLVMPALPGYAFSGKPTETGWNYSRTAHAWGELMQRLGYANGGWVAQGGDWGAHVAAYLGHQEPKGLRAIHFNSIFFESKKELQTPAKDERGVERAMKFDKIRDAGHKGYSLQMSTRPQTIGYALADSPVAQAAWIYEKYKDWSHHDGDVEKVFTKDEMLDTIMLYWLSNSGTSSGRYYWENKPDSTAVSINLPVGVSWFGGDNSYAPKEWCDRYYKNIVYWKETDRGGHFAAWEVPELFVSEMHEWKRKIGHLLGST